MTQNLPARSWRAGKARRRAVPADLPSTRLRLGLLVSLRMGFSAAAIFRTIIAARHAAWAGADVDQVAQELQRLCASSAYSWVKITSMALVYASSTSPFRLLYVLN